MDRGIRRVGVVAWSLLGTLLLIGVVIWVVLQVWIIIPPVVLAIAIIYLINPVVNRLQRRGVARWMGSCLSYLVLAGFLTLAGFLVIPSIASQGRDLATRFPTIYDGLVADAEQLAANVGLTKVDLPTFEELQARIGEGDFISSRLGRITDITLGVLEGLLLLILAPVVAFYALLDLPKIRRNVTGLIPERHQAEVAHVARQLGTAVGGFLRGQLLVALIVGVMTSVGFWIVGLPFWLVIGMIAGFLNIIPFIGPWVGGALGVLTALATRDLQTALWALLVAVIVQQIDNHFISPTVLRATVRLHPALIILGLVAGASIAGFWGVLLAVPVMASVKIVAGHLWRTRVLGQSWDEVTEALIQEPPAAEPFLARLRHPHDGDAPGEGEPEPDLHS